MAAGGDGLERPPAARRGEPSYVWRSGQERRLAMIDRYAPLQRARVLVVGCGLGLYPAQIQARFEAQVTAFDIELERVRLARQRTPLAHVAAAEALPYPAHSFDVTLANEVIEHVADDQAAAAEMVRVTRPGGRVVIFCPNRGYPFETHGYYWRGRYHFGNAPLLNWLPTPWRDRLAPHARAYTRRSLRALFAALPVRVLHHGQIYGGYDNITARRPALGRALRRVLYALERTPLQILGLSHLLVLEKQALAEHRQSGPPAPPPCLRLPSPTGKAHQIRSRR